MSGSSPTRIAAAVVQREDGRMLLLRRALTHSTNPGKWCFVTGYVEEGEQPREAAIRELAEELGLRADPVRGGEIVVVHAEWGDTLNVYPFLFRVEQPNIVIEHEHSEFVWIEPQELYAYDFVQQLDEDLISLGLLAGR
jgi:8-oxo-dGTP pyrophosphatase MutT (NUDIX family)